MIVIKYYFFGKIILNRKGLRRVEEMERAQESGERNLKNSPFVLE